MDDMQWDKIMELLLAFGAVLSAVNGFLSDSKAKTWLGRIVNFLSVLTRKDAPGTFKMPMSHGPKAAASKKRGQLKALVLLPVAFLASSCACWGEKRNETSCVVLHQTIDCSQSSLASVLPSAAAMLLQLISGGSPNFDALLDSLTAGGFANAMCIVEALRMDFASKPGAVAEPASSALAELSARIRAKYGVEAAIEMKFRK